MARHVHAQDANPRCAARFEGADEREAVTKAARTNTSAGSIQHSRDRVAKFQESFNVLKDSLDVLVGYALSESWPCGAPRRERA
eukprot:3080508-Pyramimonas_sp.AAC.1